MGYIYQDSPDWRDKAVEGLSSSFGKSLEFAMLRKQRKQDEAKALAEKIALAGLQELPAGANPEDFTDHIQLDGKTLGKPLSDFDKRKRAAELKNIEEGSPINYFDPVSQSLKKIGSTSKKGGEIIKGELPKQTQTKDVMQSPSLVKERIKTRTSINTMTENNKILKEEIHNVSSALERVPTGATGKVNLRALQLKASAGISTPEENQTLQDYQIIESFLKDQQLAKQTLLKGATSDKDLAIVEKAVAGNFWAVAPQIMPILRKALQKIDADETAAHKSYKENFGEDFNKADTSKTLHEDDPMGLFK
jgi:hypothetical protein